MSLDNIAEARHAAACRDAAYDAMQELRDTLRPNFDPAANGYQSVEHARVTIISQCDKRINKLCADHLRRTSR